MPSFIIRQAPSSLDGSTMGGLGIVMVTALSAEAAKIDGASQLGCRPSEVIAEPYGNAVWDELKGG